MTVINSPEFKWKMTENNGYALYYKGCANIAKNISDQIKAVNTDSDLVSLVFDTLKELKDFTSGIIETESHIIAWVDHIRTWPIYYTNPKNKFLISPDARTVQKEAGISDIDDLSALEFAMASFATGRHTIFKELFCLQPGEMLVWNKHNTKLSVHRYFQYIPRYDSKTTEAENIKQLGRIFDTLTQKIISRANNKTIWIPLSAGLDSRILLCKLHEHGYSNIQTFTYGPKFNFEALHAKKIARQLNVPWQMITPDKKFLHDCFYSDERKNFWNFADGLKTTPCMREFSSILYLHQSGQVKKGDIFINGQTGDYLSGGHISRKWFSDANHSFDDYCNVIINKHYDLWRNLKTNDNLALTRSRISALLPNDYAMNSNARHWAAMEEVWEYQGRQVCYVAHGQRVYECFDYDWEMPLWEKELVDFFQNLPFEQKINQNLYKKYLRDYNYKNLFPAQEPHLWRWPLPVIWVVPVARILGALFGTNVKNNFYARMRYYGHVSNQYICFPLALHKKTFKIARNVRALHVRHWIKEHKNFFPKNIISALKID